MTQTSIFLIDDHPLFVEGVKEIIQLETKFSILGIAHSGQEALEKISTFKNIPDVVIMDIDLPDMSGLDLARVLTKTYANTRVIILSMYDNILYIKKALRAGASGYVCKNQDTKFLIDAIKKVSDKKTNIPAEVILAAHSEYSFFEDVKLTKRELQVVKLLSNELTTNEIATQLFLSTHTVDSHRKNLMRKLNVKSVVGIVRYAVENKLIKE